MTLKQQSRGIVYLVGGGPGDPGLITVKGLERLKQCEVVIYDALINPALLEHCPPRTERIFVGKRRHRHAFEQKEINALMLKCADEGKKVCRLKGGDPFLFGRGGEEAEFLFEHGIRFEVIPGISSIIGAPAYAGIPLTHRDYASHVTIVTGQNSTMGEESSQDRWEPYHYLQKKTMVILMGFAHVGAIIRRLISLEWPTDTPIALICSGTHANQLIITGTLSDFENKVERLKYILSAPAMIIIGEVVRMREKMPHSSHEIDLLPISQLKIHEETIPSRVLRIKQEISQSGCVVTPILVEKDNFIVLNGHHRLAALKELGCEFAPCLLVDYQSPYIEVKICPEGSMRHIDKDIIIQAALTNRPFPPRSSLHELNFNPPAFSTPLAILKIESVESVNR